MIKKWRRSLLVLLAIAAAFMLGSKIQDQFGLSFSLEGLADFRQWVADLGWWGPAAFVTLVTFRLFIGLTSHVVLILGGLVFGALGGTVWGSLGLLASALLLYFAAHLLGEDWVRPRLGDRYANLGARIHRVGAGSIFAISAHPVGPLTPLNLAAGLVRFPVWEFTLAVALAVPIRAAVYSILGTAVLNLSLFESVAIGAALVGVFVLPLLIPSVRAWVFGVDTLDREE
jgi:uncharacterized membrane protein YdjX (TVP38/TMEM64 family)